jgi:hypothetical protein
MTPLVCAVCYDRLRCPNHWTITSNYSTLASLYISDLLTNSFMNVKILIFLHGTSIMHRNAKGLAREEAIRQVMEGNESLHDYESYIPVGNAAKKLRGWKSQGATICYLSSHKNAEDVEKDKFVLKKYALPDGQIFYRRNREEYKDVVERIRPLPSVIIEDNCESIGGKVEMVYPNLKLKIRDKIESIVVKEFAGIDCVPDEISELMKYNGK